jgi:hypothetical protein
MFGAAKNLSARLKTRQFSPSESVFPDIDSDGLIRQLNPAVKGAIRGAEDLPLSAMDGLDQVETEIIEIVNEHRRRGLNNYDQHIQVYAQRLARAVDARAKVGAEAETARMELSRFGSGFLRAILALEEAGYGSKTQRRVQAGCGSDLAHERSGHASGCVGFGDRAFDARQLGPSDRR